MSRGAGQNVQCGQQLKTGDTHCPAMCLCMVKGFGFGFGFEFGCRTQGMLLAGNSSALNKQTSHTSSLISRGRIRCSRTRSSGQWMGNGILWIGFGYSLSMCPCMCVCVGLIHNILQLYVVNWLHKLVSFVFPTWTQRIVSDLVFRNGLDGTGSKTNIYVCILSGHVFHFCLPPLESRWTRQCTQTICFSMTNRPIAIAIGSSSHPRPEFKFTACVCFSK